MTLDTLYQLLDGPHYQVVNALALIKYAGEDAGIDSEIMATAIEWLETIHDMTEAEFSAWKGEE
jgi:hypothetical protein